MQTVCSLLYYTKTATLWSETVWLLLALVKRSFTKSHNQTKIPKLCWKLWWCLHKRAFLWHQFRKYSFDHSNVIVLDWSAYSLNLSQTLNFESPEITLWVYIWNTLKRKVKKHSVTSKTHIKFMLYRVGCHKSRKIVSHVLTMHQKFVALIKGNGGASKYWNFLQIYAKWTIYKGIFFLRKIYWKWGCLILLVTSVFLS